MSRVFYKFRSEKDYGAYRFDAAADGVPVWELKREIVAAKRLSRATDFDLVLANAATGEAYTDDVQVVPRNTQVVVRRIPAAGGPRRIAAMPAASWRPAGSGITGLTSAGLSRPSTAAVDDDTEEGRIRAMMAAGATQWEQNQAATADTQADVSAARQAARQANRVVPGPRPWLAAMMPAPPEGYVCYRCGQRGHYIQHCPTNSDPAFDRARVRRTTGIPRSFLKPVAVPEGGAAGADMAGLLVTPDGSFVVATPNEQEWTRLATVRTTIATSTAVPASEVPEALRCGICRGLLQAAVVVPCCGASFCDECLARETSSGSAPSASGSTGADAIMAALHGAAREIACPVCRKRILPSRVEPDADKRAQVRAFLEARASGASGPSFVAAPAPEAVPPAAPVVPRVAPNGRPNSSDRPHGDRDRPYDDRPHGDRDRFHSERNRSYDDRRHGDRDRSYDDRAHGDRGRSYDDRPRRGSPDRSRRDSHRRSRSPVSRRR